jgi:hypothetical protein
MTGVPFNPDNCIFVANQALNANQFRGVLNSSNTTNHTVLWDIVEEKLYWVNTLTNIIEREIPGTSSLDLSATINYVGVVEGGYQYSVTGNGGSGNGVGSVNTLVGGTGYTNGTYVVPAVGGTGSGATFTITVVAGIVTNAVIATKGSGYGVNNILTLIGGNVNSSVKVASLTSYTYPWAVRTGPLNNFSIVGSTTSQTVTVDDGGNGGSGLLECIVTDADGSKTQAYFLAQTEAL